MEYLLRDGGGCGGALHGTSGRLLWLSLSRGFADQWGMTGWMKGEGVSEAGRERDVDSWDRVLSAPYSSRIELLHLLSLFPRKIHLRFSFPQIFSLFSRSQGHYIDDLSYNFQS